MVEQKNNKVDELINSIDKFLENLIFTKELFYSLILNDFDTGKNEFKVMNILFNHPDSSVGYIAESIRLDISTVTSILNNMSDKDFITRQRDQKDRRNVLVKLSEKGINIFKKNKVIEQNIHQSLISEFNSQELNQFSKLLEKIFSNDNILVQI